MPSPRDKLRVTREHDKRIKLMPEDREQIVYLHKSGLAIREIARRFSQVSRRLIQFVIFPERLATVNFKGHYKKYYDKNKHKLSMQKHRAYKKKLYE